MKHKKLTKKSLNFVNGHGILPISPLNFPQILENAKFGQKDGHGKSRSRHGKVMESLGTLKQAL